MKLVTSTQITTEPMRAKGVHPHMTHSNDKGDDTKCGPQTKANGVTVPRDITGKACNQAPDSFLEGGGQIKSLALDNAYGAVVRSSSATEETRGRSLL